MYGIHITCYSQFKAKVDMEIVMFETLQGSFEDCQYSINAKSNLTTSEANDCMFNSVA
jgi:hypothetical protein